MITAYEVGATFRIQDAATPTLQNIARQFKELQGIIDRTQASLAEFGKGIPFKRMTEGLAAINKEMGNITIKAGEIGTAFDTKVDSSINSATGAAANLTRELSAARDMAAEIRVAPGALSGGGRAGIGGASGASGAAAAGQTLTPGGGIRLPPRAGAGGPPHGGLGRIGTSVPGPGHTHFRTHSPLIIGGLAAGIGLWEGFDKAAELATIEENLRIGNVPPEQIQAAERLSYQLGEKYNLPVQDVMKAISETRIPLGGMPEAMEHAETLAKASNVLHGQDTKRGTQSADQLYNLVRSSEFRNAIKGPDFDKAISGMVAADVATAGRVNPSEFLNMVKYMRGALPGLSDEFLYKYAPELAQEYKGAGGGTALASLYQQIEAGQMRTTGLRLLDQLGEVDRTKVDFDKSGRIVKARPGFMTLGGVFKRDPAEFIADQIQDMVKHGITDVGDQRDWFSMIYGNRNAANMAMTLGYQKMRLDRGAAGIGSVWNLDRASEELLQNDPRTKQRGFTSSFNNMLTSLGESTIGPMTQFFKDAGNLFNFIRDPNTSSQWRDFTRIAPLPMRYANAPQASWYDEWQSRKSLSTAGYRHDDLALEMGRERSRGQAASSTVVAPPQVNVKVETKANVDWIKLITTVEQEIMPAVMKAVTGALSSASILNSQAGAQGSHSSPGNSGAWDR